MIPRSVNAQDCLSLPDTLGSPQGRRSPAGARRGFRVLGMGWRQVVSRDGRRVALMGLAWACLLSAGQVVMGVEPVISEFMASNAGTLADEDGDHSDWIEIHNPDAGAVNLAGWYLTDDAADLTKWAFPDIDVAGDAYMVVFASGKDRATAGEELHAGFKLSAGGEYIALVMPDGVSVVDEFGPEYPPQHADISYGRIGASVGYFATATPGASNALVAYEGFAEDVVFDVDHGYFEFPFALALSSETAGAEIHYTTNGSVPTESDPSYSGSMMIGETTIMRARAFRSDLLPSRTATRTYLFVDDIVLQSPDGQEPGPAWPEPYGPHSGFHDPQDIDYGMDPDIVVHDARYAGLVEDALLAVPSMSLVTDLAHLFDPSSGIYVNAKQRGEAWERPASLELIDPNGDAGFQIDCGVRIRGGWSRWGSCPKHALRFYFDSDYGDEMLEFPLFGDEGASAFRKVDLRTAQNYSWAFKGDSRNTMLRDIFCRGLQREMGQPYTRSRYVHLYIDGQYWGLYQTQERSKADFAETYLGGNRDDYDTVKVGDTLDVRGEVEVADGNADAWNALRAAAVVGFADNDDYFGVQGLHPDGTRDPGQVRLVDVDNLIDFMICIYYMGTDDAPISSHLSNTCNNFYGVFNRSHPDGFKWFVHDNEHVMDIKGLHYNRTGDLTVLGGDWGQYFNPQTLHQELDVNPEYVMRFADHVHEHFFNGGALTPDRLLVMWDGYAADIELAIVAESARWGDAKVADPLTRDDDWAPNVQYVHDTFIPQRTGIVLGQFRSRGWYPNVDAPVFSVNGVPQHGGHASVGDELTMANPNGAGIVYYTVDGSDPRVVGGAVSGTAQVFDGTPVLLTGSLYVKSRVLAAGGWSALNAAGYDVDSLPIVISEIMYHPAGDADAEFVEMHNPSGTHGVDMSGWRLEGVGLTFPEGTMLPAGAYAVVARDLAAFEDTYGAGTLVVATYGGRLDNGGELLSLVDGAGTCVDVVRYEDVPPWPVSPDGSGPSLELVDVASDNAQVAGWASSLAPLGTPGAANSVAGTTPPLPALWVNEVLPVNQSVNTDEAGGYDPWIELYNASSDPINVGGMYVTDDYATPTKWQISPGTVVDAAGWLLIWADGAPGEGAAHTNFTLDPAGGGVGLYTSDGRVVDYVNYGPLPADVSYGKYPDGFVACRPLNAPTPGGANVSGSAAVILNEYNAVSSGNFLKDGGSDGRLGVVQGNGGNWFELVVTEDHTDMRQWSLAWTEGGDAGVLVLTDAPQWADLRAGTIVTFSELDHAAGGLDTDMSYDPAGGDWWLHVNTLSGGVAQGGVCYDDNQCARRWTGPFLGWKR